jgi:hypothetical protein
MILGLLVVASLTSKTSTKEHASTPNRWCQSQVMHWNSTWMHTWRPLAYSLGLGTCVKFNPNEGSKDSLVAWVIWASHNFELHRAIVSIAMLVVWKKHLSTREVRLIWKKRTSFDDEKWWPFIQPYGRRPLIGEWREINLDVEKGKNNPIA